MNIIGQFIGFMAFIFFIYSLQKKEKKDILFIQIISFSLYSAQYLCLGAYIGMIAYIINTIRSIIFFMLERSNKRNLISFVILLFASFYFCTLAYNETYDILAIIATTLSVFIMWQKNIILLRIGQIMVSSLWIIYNSFVNSYFGILSESIIVLFSFFILLNNKYGIDMYIYQTYLIKKYKISKNEINVSKNLLAVKRDYLKILVRCIFKGTNKIKNVSTKCLTFWWSG